ncbi:uncharacterized protein LOC135095828 isoform X2 [Scylla paramamosain]|uniref:uncharacterized protein LOC135095828 isoform X2 n=1 Tax=Scylla paramamosain TaxID=85552 RepID=UPI003082994A
MALQAVGDAVRRRLDGRHGQHPSLARCPTATAPQRTDATAPHRTDAIATAAHLCSRCLPCTAISVWRFWLCKSAGAASSKIEALAPACHWRWWSWIPSGQLVVGALAS